MIVAEFSENDFQTLSDWLMRRDQGIFDILELDGFFTAIVIGPNTLSPLKWLPKVWAEKARKFKDLEEINRFIALVMGYYNSVIVVFESEPRQFEPTFYERQVSGKTIVIVDEWCTGFLKGMRLDASAWTPSSANAPSS